MITLPPNDTFGKSQLGETDSFQTIGPNGNINTHAFYDNDPLNTGPKCYFKRQVDVPPPEDYVFRGQFKLASAKD